MPASEQQSLQFADNTARLEPPVNTSSSPPQVFVRSTFGLPNHEYNVSQVSLPSTTDSFHTAPTRSRERSVSAPPSPQVSTHQSARNSAALLAPFDSIESQIELETGPALPGSRPHAQPDSATDNDNFYVDEPVLTESNKMQKHTDKASDISSSARDSCAAKVEHFLKDIMIFNPCPESMISTIILVRLDSGSDNSFISPRILKSLGILPDSDLIQPSNLQYATLGGPVVATGMITLSWRIFNNHNGPSDHDKTSFYISPDNLPYGALFGQDVLGGLNPNNGQPRMNMNFMNITIPPTKEEEEDAKKAKEKHDREVEENKRAKKEKKAAAARKGASSSSDSSADIPGRK
ncbi:hypothetical protein N431DRAFT_104140 [Stipitochalara longipes BDJ]|nr:hypothetical protein N431DRAFT_104140 [Stipitochalara longipes BDJ]